MKCPNCGAEISDGSKACEFCGSQITVQMQKEQEQLKKKGCPKCGSTNVTFNREKMGEAKGKKGMQVVRATVGVCKDCGYTWTSEDTSSKKKAPIWLWVIGWLLIFPLPLTILLLRPTCKLDKKVRIGIIIAAWLVYIIIGASGGGKDEDKDDKRDTTSINREINDEEDSKEVIEITSIDSNVNADDGTVLFTVKAKAEEDTKLTVSISNTSGYNATDTITILKDGKGSTSEFSDNGNGLNGKYTVTVSDSDGNVLKSEDFTFDYKVEEEVVEEVTEEAVIEEKQEVSEPTVEKQEPVVEEAKTEEAVEEKPADTGVVDPDLKAFLDSYEEFMDEYCEFMESYDYSDTTMLMQYANLMTKYSEFAEAADAYDSSTMSATDSAYYLEVMTRVNAKLAKVAYSF